MKISRYEYYVNNSILSLGCLMGTLALFRVYYNQYPLTTTVSIIVFGYYTIYNAIKMMLSIEEDTFSTKVNKKQTRK